MEIQFVSAKALHNNFLPSCDRLLKQILKGKANAYISSGLTPPGLPWRTLYGGGEECTDRVILVGQGFSISHHKYVGPDDSLSQGCPVQCGMFSTLGLYPLCTKSNLSQLWKCKMTQDIIQCLLGAKLSPDKYQGHRLKWEWGALALCKGSSPAASYPWSKDSKWKLKSEWSKSSQNRMNATMAE